MNEDVIIFDNTPYICLNEKYYTTNTFVFPFLIKNIIDGTGKTFCIYTRTDLKTHYIKYKDLIDELIKLWEKYDW